MESKATALLLNWKRSDNLEKIITSLRQQSTPVDIFLWDNNPVRQFDVDLHIQSNHNLMCWPRWFMANYAKTEFVFTLDDDFIPNNDMLIEYCIGKCNKYNSTIGPFGVVVEDGQMKKLPWDAEDQKCDCLLGKFIFTKREYIKDTKMFPWEESTVDSPRIEDDIFIGSSLSSVFHIGDLYKYFDDAEGPGGTEISLWRQPDHFPSRNKFAQKFFGATY